MGLYSLKSGLILGFHGCERNVRDGIVSGIDTLRYNNNPYDWLGYGNYVWENNYDRALHFAQNLPGGNKFDEPAVLGAVIDLDFCLDLLDTENIRLVHHSFTVLQTAFESAKKPMPVNRTAGGSPDLLLRHLDCAVIENLHRLRGQKKDKPFDSVRGMFAEGEPLYSNAGFRDKNHIQICVRNPNCIKGFFIPRAEEEWPVAVST